MTSSLCLCGGPDWLHYAPNDVAVILNRKTVGECAHCSDCPTYRHASGPSPKPRPHPSAATIQAVRERDYHRSHPAPRPVREGTKNTYSNEREVPM